VESHRIPSSLARARVRTGEPDPRRARVWLNALTAISLAHSVVYLALLIVWLAPGYEEATTVLGWTHGFTWIGMSLLTLYACLRRYVGWIMLPLVSVVGVILGPFAGTVGFVLQRRQAAATGQR
jgi:cellulose synthase/poly-beta-1,6-N-acetylglucosamine synthase-like glycosyltransferase